MLRKVVLIAIAVVFGSVILIGVLTKVFLPESEYREGDASSSESSQSILQPPCAITAFTYKVVEKNNSWWKYSWKLTVANNMDSSLDCRVTIRFLDRDGYVLDKHWDYPPDLPPKTESVISSYSLVDTELAYQVTDLDARVD